MGTSILRVHSGSTETSFKLVGVHLDEHLNYKQHINKTYNKVASSLAMLKRSKIYLPLNVRKLIYNALIKSHLEYCISIWGSSQKSIINKLETAQKKAVRIVMSTTYNSHTDPIFTQLNQLKLPQLYDLACAKLALAVVKDTAPEGLKETYRVLEDSKHATRATIEQTMLYTPTPKTDQMRRMPTYQLPNIFNNKFQLTYKDQKTMPSIYMYHQIQEYSKFVCPKPNQCHSCLTLENHKKEIQAIQAAKLAEQQTQSQQTQPTPY